MGLRPLAAFAAAVFAVILALCGCASHSEVYSAGISDAPEGAGHESGPGYARYSDKDLGMEVSYLAPGKLDLYFTMFRGGAYANPFPPRSYMVFSLSLMNRGDNPVSFNPAMTAFITDDRSPLAPKDFAGLYTDLSVAGAEDVDRRMDAFRASSFDTSVALGPGERVHRLIAFSRVDEAAGGGALMFNGLYVDGRNRPVVIRYDEDLGLDE